MTAQIKKIGILILGPHRSGSSALAGAVHCLGLDFGPNMMLPSFDNPKGYFEDPEVIDLNDQILGEANGSWNTPRFMDAYQWDKLASSRHYKSVKALIIQRTQDRHIWVAKDPRLCILLPLWKMAFEDLGLELRCILNYRDLSEMAGSLIDRNGFSTEKAALLSLGHLLSAEHFSRSLTRSFVTYDQLLSNPVKALQRVFREIEIQCTWDQSTIQRINQYVSGDLKNQNKSTILSVDRKIPKDVIDHIRQSETLFKSISEMNSFDIDMKDKLNEAFEEHQSIINDFYQRESMNPDIHILLLVEDNKGLITRQHSTAKRVNGKQRIEILLPKNDHIYCLTFIPVQEPCTIRLFHLGVYRNQQEVYFELSENSYEQSEDMFYFDMAAPKIILTFKSPQKLSSFIIELEYVSLGHATVPGIHSKKRWSRLIWETIVAVTSHPGRLLSSLNIRNIQKLRSAIRRESPRQIVRNLKKFILARNTQQQVLPGNQLATVKHVDRGRRNNLQKRLTVLYVFHTIPQFDQSSGDRRSFRLLEILSELANVSILCIEPFPSSHSTLFNEMGISVYTGGKIANLRKEIPQIDFIIFSHYYLFHDEIKLLNHYPEARTIIDSVDIHWLREERALGNDDNFTPSLVRRNKKRELKAYAMADAVWAVSEPDRNTLLKELPGVETYIVSNVHDVVISNYKAPGQKTLLFLGNYNHHPNISAVRILALEIFPSVLKEVPGARLIIAGSNAPEEVSSLGSMPGVQYKGFIPENELADLYRDTLLSVVPLTFGSGIKGKILESIVYMTPVLTNKTGNEGIDLKHGISGLIANNTYDFVTHITDALNGKYDLSSIAYSAQKTIHSLVSEEAVRAELIQSLFRPVVICIVTWNRLDLLRSCLQSIRENTNYPNYTIHIYSNGCEDGTQVYLTELKKEHPDMHINLGKENKGFVIPNNIMIEQHADADIVLLNNDTKVTRNWLMPLYLTAYSKRKIGIVGSKILYPDGRLQEYGSEIWEDGTGRNIGKYEDDPYGPEYSTPMAVGYVSGCVMYIKRDTINSIGILDEVFHPCYYEDSDFCYRSWYDGWETHVCPDSIVYHIEGASAGKDETQGFKKYQSVNRQKFIEKHKSNLSKARKKINSINKTANNRN